jgi:ABC-type branched-subunit amino acid transport system substrate-binding protein
MFARRSRVLRAVLPGALGLALVAGCGSRLSQGELIALNGGSVTTVTEDTGGTGAATGTDTGPTATNPGVAAPSALPLPTAAGGTAPRPGPSSSALPVPGTATPSNKNHNAGSAASTGAAAAALRTDNKPITICSVSELGGPAGAALAQGVNGAQAWVGDVNSHGGVAGHQIRLMVKDSGSDPNVALADARDCVENQGAVALVASMAPFTSRGMMPYLQSKGVPAIGGDCGSSAWNDSPVLFNQCATVENNYWALSYEAAHAGAANNKFAFLTCQEAQTCAEGKHWEIEERFAEKNGLNLVYTKVFSLTQLDFTSECSAMKAAGATTVLTVADPSALQRLGQSCARQGFNPIWTQPYASVNPDTPTKAGLGNIRLEMPVMPFCCVTGKDAQNATYQRYVTDFQRYGGSRPAGPAAVIGFTAGLLFERFLTDVAKTTPTVTSAALLKVAGEIKHETLGGSVAPINLTTGQKTPDSRCWFTMVARNGGAWQVPNGLKPTCRQ